MSEFLAAIRTAVVIARKEIVELRRQPAVLALVVLGPFAVLAAFGLGYRNEELSLRTILVGPEDSPYEEALDRYAGSIEDYVVPLAFTSDVFAATEDLRAGRADVVIVLPPSPVSNLLDAERSEIAVIHNSIDPIEQIGIEFAAEVAVRELNATIVTASLDAVLEAAREIDADAANEIVRDAVAGVSNDDGRVALDALDRARAIDQTVDDLSATVLARPFYGETEPLLRKTVRPEHYVAPGATALLLQHLGVSLAALSLVRDDRRGILVDYQVGPTSAGSVLFGKLLSLSVVSFWAGLFVIGGQALVLGVPQRGSWLAIVALLIGVSIASVAVGLALATVSRSELHATQTAMIGLLIGLFFSGFILNTDLFNQPFRSLGLLAPSFPGVTGLRSVQLRGVWPTAGVLVTLLVQAAVAVTFARAMLGRRWRSRQ